MSNYTLEIISHHPKFNGKSLKKYYVEGIETVGAWGDEPFEVRFKNHTWQKVQVIISVDGTDVLTGKPADTIPSKDMWVVNGYDTLSLKAWPENNNGGAGFVFTNANNSVAIHTHGDLSNRGIIAAAVFVEGHVEPIRINPPVRVEEHHHHHYPKYTPPSPTNPWPWIPTYEPVWIYQNSSNSGDYLLGNNVVLNNCTSNSVQNTSVQSFGPASLDSCYFSTDISDSGPVAASAGLETLVSVGAGQHVDQKITYVSGLIKPIFTETVRVRYLWWDELVAKLRTATAAQAQPSGFPGDKKKNIDLKGTPRIGSSVHRTTEPVRQVFDRV
jgi:hypothetical protein